MRRDNRRVALFSALIKAKSEMEELKTKMEGPFLFSEEHNFLPVSLPRRLRFRAPETSE